MMPPYGPSDLLGETRRNPHHLWSVLAACMGRIWSPTEARHVTEFIDVAASPHQGHQAGFTQRGRRSVYSGRMGTGAGRHPDDVPMQSHMRLNQADDREPRPQDQ